jgi:hypothetical protein
VQSVAGNVQSSLTVGPGGHVDEAELRWLPPGHAEHDSFIPAAHSERLVAAYAGDANMVTFEGDHNTHRPAFFYASVLIFLHAVLRLPEPLPAADAAALAAKQGGCEFSSIIGTSSRSGTFLGSTWLHGWEVGLQRKWASSGLHSVCVAGMHCMPIC